MVGVGLGITIGGTILAFILSSTFRSIAECRGSDVDPTYESLCGDRRGSLSAVWFWSGIVFWLNFCSSLLLAIGRREFTMVSQYEAIGGGFTMDDYEDHVRRFQQNNPTFPGDMPTPTASFVGDYASVPEIRPGDQDDDRSIHSDRSGRSGRSGVSRDTEQARIQNV